MALESPLSFAFIAAGLARRVRLGLIPLKPSRVNAPQSWDGHSGDIGTGGIKVPIADPDYWNGRLALTTLTFQKESGGDPLVMNDAVVSVTREKRIVRTGLVGLDGTIKEYISNGDYDISITVGIVALDAEGNITDEYPADGVKAVRGFLDENKAIQVAGEFLGIFEVSRMVITRFSVRQATDSNRQVIEIKAFSDTDYTIKCDEY